MAPGAELTSVVVLTRDQLAFSRRCLETLAATAGELEWIVVDNGSSDGTRDYLARWQGKAPSSRTVIPNEPTAGAARARNQGWRRARGDWVAFIDNDVYLDADPDWLSILLTAVRDDPAIAAASPLLLFPGEPAVVQCAGGGVTAAGRFGLLGRGMPLDPGFGTTRPQAWAPTAALVVRRSALESASGFDEAFDPVPICEDIDLCCRLRAGGGGIAFVGSSRLRHSEGTTFGHLGYDKRGYWARHARVIKERWMAVLTSGPVHDDEDIAWRPVYKEYDDFDSQHVRLAVGADRPERDLTFFASAPTLTAPPPPLRIGVIGCGQAALRGALPGLSPPDSPVADRAAPFLAFGGCDGAIVAGVADVDADRASEAAALVSAPTWTVDGHELLARTPMEGVVVATPPRWHAEHCLAALERDIPVLVEKPGAANEEELDAVLTLLEERPGAFCMVNLPWEFHPAVHAAAMAIAAGGIGVVRSASALFEHSGPQAWSPRASWYFDRRDGGVVRDLGLHAVAALERLLGAPLVELAPVGCPRSSRAVAEAPVGDADVRVELGWDAPQPRFTVSLHGTDGDCHLELIPYRGAAAPWLSAAGRKADLPCSSEAIERGTYRHFVACLRSGEEPLTDLRALAPGLRTVLRWALATDRDPAST